MIHLVRSSLLVASLLLCAGFAARTRAQTVTVAWDTATDGVWTVPEYRIYVTRPAISETPVLAGSTSDLFFPVDLSPGETIIVGVSSYSWRLDENMNVVWAESQRSPPTAYTAPVPTPPPSLPPPELCAPDGTGNGVDENGDGQIDEGCLPKTSPNGTVGTSIVDCASATWTLSVYNETLRDDVPMGGGAGTRYKLLDCTVWVLGMDSPQTWWWWNGSWIYTGQTQEPRPAPTPLPTAADDGYPQSAADGGLPVIP